MYVCPLITSTSFTQPSPNLERIFVTVSCVLFPLAPEENTVHKEQRHTHTMNKRRYLCSLRVFYESLRQEFVGREGRWQKERKGGKKQTTKSQSAREREGDKERYL